MLIDHQAAHDTNARATESHESDLEVHVGEKEQLVRGGDEVRPYFASWSPMGHGAGTHINLFRRNEHAVSGAVRSWKTPQREQDSKPSLVCDLREWR